MGCCLKKKKKNNLVKKLNSEEEDNTEEKDFNTFQVKLNYNDFTPLKLLGRGSYGQVCLVRLKINNKLYAMKILDKSLLKAKKQEIHTQAERDLMVKIHCRRFILSFTSMSCIRF